MSLPTTASDETCLVTGASSGIGSDIARQLAERGRNVTLVARREDRLRSLAGSIERDYGVQAHVVTADLADQDSRASLRTTLEGRGLSVVVLVNNAGFSTLGPVVRADRSEEITELRTDVEAVVDLCVTFVPDMVRRGAGAVLNTASGAAFQPLPGQASYAASKAFVLSYTWSLRAEVETKGVTVTALCPGPVETEFNDRAGWSDEQAAQALPKILWVSSKDVATAALHGLEQGRAVVIPGAGNRVATVAGHLAPRSLLMPLLARQHPALKQP
jgi:short-subunit dehydrogenase